MEIKPIAYFHSPISGKFGVPRQAGIVPELRGEIRFEAAWNSPDAVRGLEGFDYIWLIWEFSLNRTANPNLTVRPPRLGGNERVGVFASRSPFRPNPLGLSCVKVTAIRDGVIEVSGADLADGTPIYDIKPYVTYADCHPEARSGFVDNTGWEAMDVVIPDAIGLMPQETEALRGVLAQDPRPRCKDNGDRIYGMEFASRNVRFREEDGRIVVLSAEKC